MNKVDLLKKHIGRNKWYQKGIKFECQGSGKCCLSRGGYGFVYLDIKDRQRFAKFFGITTAQFNKEYCQKSDGFYSIKQQSGDEECMFLKDNRCSVYEARPTQCRTWPFWPDVMNAKTWKKDVVEFCPGIGKGRVYTKEEIEAKISEQIQSELSMEK